MIIAITGHIGTGKTIVAKEFQKHGFKYISADTIGHKLLSNQKIKEKLVKEFGDNILSSIKICKIKLRNVVFNNPKNLRKLNKIIHPLLIKELKTIIKKEKKKNKDIVIDVALLKELKLQKVADILILIKTNKTNIYKRKTKYTKTQLNNIIKNQNITNKYDFCILNNTTKQDLIKKTKKIIKKTIKKLKTNKINKNRTK